MSDCRAHPVHLKSTQDIPINCNFTWPTDVAAKVHTEYHIRNISIINVILAISIIKVNQAYRARKIDGSDIQAEQYNVLKY